MTPDELKGYVDRRVKEYTRWTRLWSFVHHISLYGAAALSAAAAIIIKVPLPIPPWDISAQDKAAMLAATAALIGTISGIGGFHRKWKTNRRTKSSFEQLQLDFLIEEVDPKQVIEKIQLIIKTHHEGIIGEG